MRDIPKAPFLFFFFFSEYWTSNQLYPIEANGITVELIFLLKIQIIDKIWGEGT